MVEPTSAPNMMAKAATPAIMPCPAKDETIKAVAVELCRIAVTPNPAARPVTRLRDDAAKA